MTQSSTISLKITDKSWWQVPNGTKPRSRVSYRVLTTINDSLIFPVFLKNLIKQAINFEINKNSWIIRWGTIRHHSPKHWDKHGLVQTAIQYKQDKMNNKKNQDNVDVTMRKTKHWEYCSKRYCRKVYAWENWNSI